MCGIFGYIGPNQQAVEEVLNGLKRLEYRGYDSWGVAAAVSRSVPWVHKQVGQIGELQSLPVGAPTSQVALAHTRWATHGGITPLNAHPHAASDGSFVLVQNGIVQNFAALKTRLAHKGHHFVSETDTEVIVRLIEDEVESLLTAMPQKAKRRKAQAAEQAQRVPTDQQFFEAVRRAFVQLEGRNTIAILTKAGALLAARHGSPLILGIGHQPQEWYLSSDTLSFADKVAKVVVIDNRQLVTLNHQGYQIWSETGEAITCKPEALQQVTQAIDKEGYPHFMLKEIFESPVVVEQVCQQSPDQMQQAADLIKAASHVFTIGSGTAGIAAAQIAYFLRRDARIMAQSLVGADAVEYLPLFQPGDVLIAPSQSGETADVLEVLEAAQQQGVKVITYVNMQGASMSRLADLAFLAQAGPEICVMSTKVFVSQLAWGYLLTQTVAKRAEAGRQELMALASVMREYLHSPQLDEQLAGVVQALTAKTDIFLLAKAQLFQVIREGMVKLVEGTYIHAHALPAGDLKHYAITLVEEGTPVIVLTAQDEVVSDVLNAANQVKARGAMTIGIGVVPDEGFAHFIAVPETGRTISLLAVLPLQLLAYRLTVALGHNVDHPRNIAKSVTVK